VIGSFIGAAPNLPGRLRPSDDIRIWLESTDDNSAFVEQVLTQLHQLNPAAATRARKALSLQNTSPLERDHYLQAAELDWDARRKQEFLERVARSGQKIAGIDLIEGFTHVRIISLRAGEKLIEAGTPSSFVYLPLGDGLRVIPMGGYQSFSVKAWMQLGSTGVIRGAMRNAIVVTEKDVSLLVIPKETYLKCWHNPYTIAEFHQLLGG
jgi:hypothetical protein